MHPRDCWVRRCAFMDDLRIDLPRDPSAPRLARRALEERFDGVIAPSAMDSAKLVATELVANAYDHGRGAIELRAALRADRLTLEVVDEGRGAAIEAREVADAGGGRGLHVVRSLSHAWGVHDGTTHVRAELSVGAEHD